MFNQHVLNVVSPPFSMVIQDARKQLTTVCPVKKRKDAEKK